MKKPGKNRKMGFGFPKKEKYPPGVTEEYVRTEEAQIRKMAEKLGWRGKPRSKKR